MNIRVNFTPTHKGTKSTTFSKAGIENGGNMKIKAKQNRPTIQTVKKGFSKTK